MSNETFIFSICYNCGKILNKALESFFKYHPDETVHVFGTSKDFKELKQFKKNIEFVELSGDIKLKELYKNGHIGTAYIMSKILKMEYGDYKYIIHFDSDVVFREECLSDIYSGFDDGYAIIGQRRGYEKNRCNRNDLSGIQDAIGTCFFGLNIEKLPERDFNTLMNMVVGYYNPHHHPILDFFDPVTFDIIYNGGKVKYLDYNDYGSSNENGSWENDYPELNLLFDFGKKFIHFAGIGSGMNFINNGSGNVSETYVSWAKERYSLYMKIFYDENSVIPYDIIAYNKIKSIIK